MACRAATGLCSKGLCCPARAGRAVVERESDTQIQAYRFLGPGSYKGPNGGSRGAGDLAAKLEAADAAKEARAWSCAQRSRCCCCAVPRWSICPLCLGIVYLALAPVLYLYGYFTTYPGNGGGAAAAGLAEGCREFNFTAASGRLLPAVECSYGEGPELRRPALLFAGEAGNMYGATSLRKMLPPTVAWRVYSISLPGAQYTPRGGWTTQAEALGDAGALLRHATGANGGRPAVLVGWSLGAAVAAGTAAGAAPGRVKCLLLGVPFTSMRDLLLRVTGRLAWPWLWVVDEWPTARWVRGVTVPTIVMSGEADERIPHEMHSEVYRQAGTAHREPILKEKFVDAGEGDDAWTPFIPAVQSKVENWCVVQAH